MFYSFVSTHCPDVLITEGLGTLSRCDLSDDTSDGAAAKHGRHSNQQAARLVASRSQLYLAGPLDVDATPKCVLYVIILTFTSERPPPLLNLFLVCVCVVGCYFRFPGMEFLGEKMRSQVGRNSDPLSLLPGRHLLTWSFRHCPVLCLHHGPCAVCSQHSHQGAPPKPKSDHLPHWNTLQWIPSGSG